MSVKLRCPPYDDTKADAQSTATPPESLYEREDKSGCGTCAGPSTALWWQR